MIEKAAEKDQFIWWLPLCGLAAAAIVSLVIAIQSADLGVMFYLFAVVTIGSVLIIFAVRSKGLRRLSIVSTLVLYCTVPAILIAQPPARDTVRWYLWSRQYKTEVLGQPSTSNGELKHVEWDRWGFVGANTVVYLVFDPTDSLSAAAKSNTAGKFSGIPCKVPRVRRLENGWYTVTFYTETEWGHCR